MNFAQHDTGIRKNKERIGHNNLICKEIISKEFEEFKKELEGLCKRWNFKIEGSREWDGIKQITYMPVLKSRRIRYGKLK